MGQIAHERQLDQLLHVLQAAVDTGCRESNAYEAGYAIQKSREVLRAGRTQVRSTIMFYGWLGPKKLQAFSSRLNDRLSRKSFLQGYIVEQQQIVLWQKHCQGTC